MSHDELANVTAMARALDAKKAQNVIVLDLRKQSSYLTYFVIATALSKSHLKTLFDEVQRTATELGLERQRSQAPQFESGWVTYDLGFSVIHLFDEEKRRFYNLEDVWKNATQLDLLHKSSTDLTSRKGTSKSGVITKKKTEAKPKKSSQESASLAKKTTTIKKKTTKEKTMATAKKKPAKKKPAKKKAAKKKK